MGCAITSYHEKFHGTTQDHISSLWITRHEETVTVFLDLGTRYDRRIANEDAKVMMPSKCPRKNSKHRTGNSTRDELVGFV